MILAFFVQIKVLSEKLIIRKAVKIRTDLVLQKCTLIIVSIFSESI